MTASAASPILTLTTDFGTLDHYVGTMKGVILTVCPRAQIVDVSHGVPAFSIMSGAYTVAQAAPYFPAGTIHVVVVDPGVGTARRAILAAIDGHVFIAPDNGVLTLVLSRARTAEMREITNQELFLHPLSATFHGRDLFAPVAAAVASGTPLEAAGPVITSVEMLPSIEPQLIRDDTWRAVVLSTDRFGNIITSLPAAQFARPGAVLFVGGIHIRDTYPTFGAAPEGALFFYAGSSGFVEAGANKVNAAAVLGVGPGAIVEISLVR